MAKSKLLSKTLRDELAKQAEEEIAFARKHKQAIIAARWHRNENLIYLVKPELSDERANVGVANTKAHGFLDSLLSKIDTPPSIKYTKGEEADLIKAKYANAVVDRESRPTTGNWAMKDLMGKKQNIVYGRTIFEFHGSKQGGFKMHLEPVDAYDFLIDPAAGGLDIENADNLGRGNIYKTKEQIEEGIKSGKYLRTEGRELLDGVGGETNDKEEQQKSNRYAALVHTRRIPISSNKYKMWEWYTTYKGTRYYLLYSEQHKKLIKACPLVDMFPSGLWPFLSWAAYPDLVEFWTPAPLDYVRDIFMAQGVSINQMLDNAETINRPMKAIVAGAIKNPNALKYGRDKIVKFNKGVNIDQALKVIETKEISTPTKVYEILGNIADTESGVNAATRGVAEEDKVGIYEGNLANTSDRLGLLNKSYANAYQRLGLLAYYAIIDHMTMKYSIEMLGADGIEFAEITRSDVKPNKRMFGIFVEASDAELQNDLAAKKTKVAFLAAYKGDQGVNQKARFEMEANAAGLPAEEIKRLLDVEEYGSAELMAEAARDIQKLLQGKECEPNRMATVAYAKKILDYMWDHEEDMDAKAFARFAEYMEKVKPIVIKNMAGFAQDWLARQGKLSLRDKALPASGAEQGDPATVDAPAGDPAAIPTPFPQGAPQQMA